MPVVEISQPLLSVASVCFWSERNLQEAMKPAMKPAMKRFGCVTRLRGENCQAGLMITRVVSDDGMNSMGKVSTVFSEHSTEVVFLGIFTLKRFILPDLLHSSQQNKIKTPARMKENFRLHFAPIG